MGNCRKRLKKLSSFFKAGRKQLNDKTARRKKLTTKQPKQQQKNAVLGLNLVLKL